MQYYVITLVYQVSAWSTVWSALLDIWPVVAPHVHCLILSSALHFSICGMVQTLQSSWLSSVTLGDVLTVSQCVPTSLLWFFLGVLVCIGPPLLNGLDPDDHQPVQSEQSDQEACQKIQTPKTRPFRSYFQSWHWTQAPDVSESDAPSWQHAI